MIHIMENRTGKILDYIPLGDFWDDNHHKSLKDTLEYFEFRTFGDKRYSQHLEKMNRLIIPDEDGTFIEFVIFHAIKYRLQNAVVIDVYAPASYLLLKKAKVINPQRVSEYTASQHLGFALNGTEWRPGIVESDKYRTLDIENHTNPYAYIRRIANEFELEPRFRIETDGNKVIGRYVDLLERVGEWQGREVEFGRDLLGIERKVDDSNVVTALVGLAPERDDGTRLEVFVEDEEALQRWGIPNPQTGELMHLIETYEPESTDQNMSIERLTELTRNELEKRINSVVEYTADVADLEKVPGMESKVIRFGDTIKIKDTGFNPPLYLEARVHTQDRSLSQPEKKKVTLGDFIEYTEEEVHAIWKQLQAEIAKKVSMAQVTEVVYTKPEVDERDDAVREHADNVAENAKIEAIQVAAEDASQKAKQAEDSAKEYTDGRLQNTVAKDIFENTVTDLLNNIAQKVDSTRFEQVESELRGIGEALQREVEEHADMLEEHGGKITKLETDVDEVEGKISATIAELQSLEETVSRHETQIEANAREIALKADKQELDLLSGTVTDISSKLSVMAGKIEAKAERSEVEKLESDVSKVSQDVSKLTIDVDGIKTNVSSISQTVSNHSTQISNINSTLTQHADMIATKVEKSEFDSVTNTLGNRISTIEQTADSISLEVSDIKANVYTKSEVDEAIDAVEVGGRNLEPDSHFDGGSRNDWGHTGYFDITVENSIAIFECIQTHSASRLEKVFSDLKIGELYTLTIYADLPTNIRWMNFINATIKSNDTLTATPGQFKTYSVTFEATGSDVTVRGYMPNLDIGTKAYMDWYKLEKGNKATDWTPAPEDIDERFTDIEGTLASHSTQIEQNAQQIQLRATKTEVDTLSGRVNQAESQITQLAGQIELRATKTEVDALSGRVSTVESTIQQHADMIESKIDAGDARSIFRQEASSFTFDADQINFKGHVFGEDATFTGNIQGSTIIGSAFVSNSENTEMLLDDGSIRFKREALSITQSELNSRGLWRYKNDGVPLAMFGEGLLSNTAGLKFFYGVDSFGSPLDSLEMYYGPVSTLGADYKANIIKYSKDLIINSYGPSEDENKFIVDKIHFANVVKQDPHDNPPQTYGKIEYTDSNILLQGENGHSFDFRDISRIEFSATSGVIFDDYGNIRPKQTVSANAIWHVDDVQGRELIRVGIGSNGGYVYFVDQNFRVLADGRIISLGTLNNTSSASANLRITDNGYFAIVTSATKYKADIQEVDLSDGYAKRILNLKPKSWFDRAELESNDENVVPQRYFGLIAEDVEEAGLSEYVTYLNGEIEGIEYDRLWTLLIPIVKEHEDKLAWLETENDFLKQKIKLLEAKFNEC